MVHKSVLSQCIPSLNNQTNVVIGIPKQKFEADEKIQGFVKVTQKRNQQIVKGVIMALIVVIEVKRKNQAVSFVQDRIYQKEISLPKRGNESF